MAYFKQMIIKKFLSKIIRYIFRFIEKIKLERYSKTFSDYHEAKKYCDSISHNSYENKELNLYRYEKLVKNLDLISVMYNNSHRLLLEILLIYFNSERKLPRILDIGGAFGENQIYLKHLLNHELEYDVVESEQVVSLANSKKLNHSNFFTNISSALIKNKYDIIFSSGTLQYFEKPYEIIEEIFSSKVKFIGLTRVNFSNNPKIYSQPTLIEYHGPREGSIDFNYQKSKKVIIPNTQIDEKKLLEISYNNSYKILRKSRGIEGSVGVGRDSYTNDLVFKLNV